jgi:hypothetical protein
MSVVRWIGRTVLCAGAALVATTVALAFLAVLAMLTLTVVSDRIGLVSCTRAESVQRAC